MNMLRFTIAQSMVMVLYVGFGFAAQICHSLDVLLLGLIAAVLGRLVAVKNDQPSPS
jgi:hypothetical protein